MMGNAKSYGAGTKPASAKSLERMTNGENPVMIPQSFGITTMGNRSTRAYMEREVRNYQQCMPNRYPFPGYIGPPK